MTENDPSIPVSSGKFTDKYDRSLMPPWFIYVSDEEIDFILRVKKENEGLND